MNYPNLVNQDLFLQLIMDNIPQYIFWKDKESVYLGCNQNFATAAGLSNPNEIIGKTDYDLPWSKEDADFYRAVDQRVMQRNIPEVNFEEPQTMSDGLTKWLRTSKIPLKNTDGKVIGILGTYEDITQRKETELQLKQSSEALLEANANMKRVILDLERANMDLEQFAYATSHDLEEPLGTIRNFLPLLEKALDDHTKPEVKQHLEFISISIEKMSKLIAGILTYLRLSHYSQKMEQVDFRILLEKMVKYIEQQTDKQFLIQSNLPTNKINCFPRQIGVLWYNLILNSINFNRQTPEIKIDFEETDKVWQFSIADNGIGIEQQFEKTIYEPFKRLHLSSMFPGSGLGLSICKRIITLHSGEIWHKSKEEGGTIFYFTIPK